MGLLPICPTPLKTLPVLPGEGSTMCPRVNRQHSQLPLQRQGGLPVFQLCRHDRTHMRLHRSKKQSTRVLLSALWVFA